MGSVKFLTMSSHLSWHTRQSFTKLAILVSLASGSLLKASCFFAHGFHFLKQVPRKHAFADTNFSFIVKFFLVFKNKKILFNRREKGVNFKVNFGNYYYKIINLLKDNPPSDLAITNKPITKDFQIANH